MAFSHWSEMMSWTLSDPQCKGLEGDAVQYLYYIPLADTFFALAVFGYLLHPYEDTIGLSRQNRTVAGVWAGACACVSHEQRACTCPRAGVWRDSLGLCVSERGSISLADTLFALGFLLIQGRALRPPRAAHTPTCVPTSSPTRLHPPVHAHSAFHCLHDPLVHLCSGPRGEGHQ